MLLSLEKKKIETFDSLNPLLFILGGGHFEC